MDGDPQARSAWLYGRACKACAVAKARCVPSGDLDLKCQRCRRLLKACEQPAPSQRRRTDKKNGRVAKLEEKLDSLVLLLHASERPAAELVEHFSHLPTPQSCSPSSSIIQNSAAPSSHVVAADEQANLARGVEKAAIHLRDQGGIRGFQSPAEYNFEKANLLLDRFRTMTLCFPFVVITPSVDARTLSEERPVLYKTILAAAEQNPIEQREQVKDIMQYLSVHLLQLGEKNLDLLLGVLVHAAWPYSYFNIMPPLTNLLHEAVALLFDLGLHKSPLERNPRRLIFEKRHIGPDRSAPERTLEERRAALGCFFLISSATSYLQNMEPMRWTPYLEQCLTELERANEYSTDQLVIKMVRLQNMAEKINSSLCLTDFHQSSGSQFCPPTLYILALERELQGMKHDIQLDSAHAPMLLSHYYILKMALYEIGLSKASPPQTAHSSDFRRLEILHACLSSTDNFFTHFLAIPPASYRNFSIVQFCQLGFAINMLQRLSLFEDPTWDLQYVAQKLSFAAIVDHVCSRMDEAHALRPRGGGERGNSDIHILARIPSKLRKLYGMYEAQMGFAASTADQMGEAHMMDMECMAAFWEEDLSDFMGGIWA